MTNNLDKENRKNHYQELNKYMPLNDKIKWAKKKIKDFFIWCEENKYSEITISFSGGKDSTVLFNLVDSVHREMQSHIFLVPAYAIEITFPSTLRFIKETVAKYQLSNEYIKNPLLKAPSMPWNQILEEKGYPIFSKQVSILLNRAKRAKSKSGITKWVFGIEDTAMFNLSKKRLFLLDDKMLVYPKIPSEYKEYFPKKLGSSYFFSEKCCTYVKGGLKNDKRPTFVGVMADESLLRKKSWIDKGCNVLNNKKPMSRPLSIWNAKDIWKYIKINKLEVNEAYNFNHELEIEDQKLRFERLGCTSCPYGSSIEQLRIKFLKKKDKIENNFKLLNRYEKLYAYSPLLYKSQIINTGIFRAIIDMGVEIEFDEAYQAMFEIRQKQIKEWYLEKNFRNNLLRVLSQIENYKNYKKFPSKYKEWKYSIQEINRSLQHFGIKEKTTKEEIQEIRKQTKLDWEDKIKIIKIPL